MPERVVWETALARINHPFRSLLLPQNAQRANPSSPSHARGLRLGPRWLGFVSSVTHALGLFRCGFSRRARIHHPFLNQFFFTERTEFRTEVTEPNSLSALSAL